MCLSGSIDGEGMPMTTRKPPKISFPGWVERQIRTAEARGAFENLPGAGKPIPDLGTAKPEMAWVAEYLRRENVDVTDLLPEALALAKEVEVLPERLRRERSEVRARKLVEDLNGRISRAHARPQVGPPVRVKTVNVEDAVQRWREERAVLAPAPRPTPEPPAPRRRRRRWFRG
jgi:hypothetical protein